MRDIIAIDFDGCLCSNMYPKIGKPHKAVIEAAKKRKADGAALILWTCRQGDKLDEAVKACEKWGLEFDAINENLADTVTEYGDDPRKVSATEYWDDRAVVQPQTAQRAALKAKLENNR